MDYIKIFKKIKNEIQNHPLLELVTFKINEGLVDIEKTKEELYECLGYFETVQMESVFEFYKQCNGLVIKYKISSDIDEYSELSKSYPDIDFSINKDAEIGSINILPFEDVFIYEQNYFDKSNEGEDYMHFGNYTYKGNSFGKILFVFDLFSDTNCMAFVPDENKEEPKVIQLLDYYVVWNSSRVTFFESYLNFLAVTRGLIDSRGMLLDYYSKCKDNPLILKEVPYGSDFEPILFKELKSNTTKN
ncbi:hypothetical protein CXF68_06220 [Tenacibaculum sp. Bg11-29]|uniref:hypothetical protein n=1 Tax=Tenacibaculum sp. Bg11-29 TaxID=2058306 RepID=UPI000C326550|nr:hypothetical protein [Tenacibaculum sp. Bg11-29]PKH50319.1 hypothetical protein CXF68_06220 [Tenacibaculum sp. Bg11-29]